jgi:predicted dehydrogenase
MASERAVVVGAGGIAGAWLPPLVNEDVAVAAVVDLDLSAAERRIAQFGLDCPASSDLKATLRKTRPDFVVDLTVPEAHCEVTCTALRAGCHVVGEKPMASGMAEARRMVRAAERTGRMYMVSQSRRWDAGLDRVRRAVAQGAIGRLTTINCDFYIGAHFGGFRAKMPSPLLLDMAIHHFDLARFLGGADPLAVYAREHNPTGSWYEGDAAASCVFEMSDSVIFTYRGSWCAEGCQTGWNGDWRLVGSGGSIVCDNDAEPCGEAADPAPGSLQWPTREIDLPTSPLRHHKMRGALREMLAFLRTGEIPQTECHDNVKSLAMVFAAMNSSRKGRRLPVRVM